MRNQTDKTDICKHESCRLGRKMSRGMLSAAVTAALMLASGIVMAANDAAKSAQNTPAQSSQIDANKAASARASDPKPAVAKKPADVKAAAGSVDAKQNEKGKKKIAAANEQSKAKDEMKALEQKGEKKMLVGFDLGYFMPLQKLGEIVDGQVSGRVFFQYQDIVWWFGIGIDAGFTQLDDKTYDGNIRLLNLVAHPLLTFPLGKGFDLQVLAGVGMSVVMARLQDRSDIFDKTSLDPMIDAGVNVMYNFLGAYAVGIEGKYYHLFEDVGYNGVEVSVFFAVRF
ncbi:MAG TPA: hypothetical protein PK573_17515 [Spirochaetota bacterium]|nr:hypothetical protein [Spirochaetota bacterium]HRZ26244.1 hypothetical protein [Spirochaetota bacterium]HSA13121.1 hypothetical protein [Spirochaetota bacterium]